MFDDNFFDSWLTQKSDDVISKLDREKISTEDMLILLLKSQSNHIRQLETKLKTASLSPVAAAPIPLLKQIDHHICPRCLLPF